MSSDSLVTIVETPEFIRRIDKVMDDDERAALILFLAGNPTAGDLIPGTGGVRKLRWGLEGRDKRGGARIIHFLSRCAAAALSSHSIREERAG